jgi:hypothetical protein
MTPQTYENGRIGSHEATVSYSFFPLQYVNSRQTKLQILRKEINALR